MARPTCRAGTFYIDIPVDPPEAIPFVGTGRSARYRQTLGTKDPAEAKVRFAKRYAELHAEWKRLAAGAVPLSEARVLVLAGDYYRQLSEKLASGSHGGTPETWLAVIARAKVFAQTTEGLEQEYGGEADRLLQEAALLADTPSRIRLLEGLHRMWVLLAEAQTRRLKADFGPDPARVLYDAAASAPASASASGVVKLTDLFALWERDAKVDAKGPTTIRAYKQRIDALIAFVGHEDATRVTEKNIIDWKDDLLHKKKLSRKTIDDGYVAAARAVYGLAREKRLIDHNPTSGIKGKRHKPKRNRTAGFMEDEVRQILSAALAMDTDDSGMSLKNKLACRWVPWICAFTGARCGEITQLRREDLVTVDGIHCLRITPEAGGVKGGQYRVNPLHPQLLDMGLVEFILSRPEGYLFSELRSKPAKDGLPSTSKSVVGNIGDWVREKAGITDPEVQPNHAWRHRFKTHARDYKMDPEYRDVIQGHADGRAAANYGDHTIRTLDREMRLLPYIILDQAHKQPAKRKTTDAP